MTEMGEIENRPTRPAPKHVDADNIVTTQTSAPAPKIGAVRDRDHPTGYASIDSKRRLLTHTAEIFKLDDSAPPRIVKVAS